MAADICASRAAARRSPWASRVLAGVILSLVVAGCGGGGGGGGESGGSSGGASGNGGSHETPEGAVRGIVEVLRANNLPAIVEWVRPEDRDEVRRGLNGFPPDTRITVDEFAITGQEPIDTDRVRVKVRLFGKSCSAGLARCVDLAKKDFAVVERVDGQWYLRGDEGILDN